MAEMCVHCGESTCTTDDIETSWGDTVLLHSRTGTEACPDGSGHIACLPQIGME